MNIKWKIIASVMLLIVSIACVFIGIFLQYSQKSIEQNIYLRIESIQAIVSTIDKYHRTKYCNRIKSFINYNTSPSREALIKAFDQQNRKDLLRRAAPFLKLFKKENSYFFTMAWLTPDNHNFLRVHNPKKFGDDISIMRPDIVTANITQKQNDGYVVAGTGIVYSIVQPVSYNSNHLGIVQFALKGEFLLDTVQENLQAPVGLLMTNKKFQFVTRSQLPTLPGESYTIQSQNISFFEKISNQIDWTLPQQKVHLQNKTYIIVKVLDLLNYDKQLQGNVVVALDISQQLADINARSALIVVLSGVLLISSFLILYFSFGFLLQKITNLNQTLERNYKKLQERSDELQQERDMFMQGPVMTITWKKNENWSVERVSKNVLDLLGYSSEDFLNGSIKYASCIHPDDTGQVIDEVTTNSQDNKESFIHAPYRLVAYGGKTVWVVDTTTIIRNEHGDITHYSGYLVDISEQKEQELRLLETATKREELKRFDSLKTMAGAIAHRFNNAMMAVQGNLNLMIDTLPGESDEFKMASDAAQAAKGASQVGSMMLSYVGQHPLQLQDLPYENLVRESVTALKEISQPSLSLHFTLPQQPLYCSVDQKQIKEVIGSILTNAVESLDDNTGTIDITFGIDYFAIDSFPIPFQDNNLQDGIYVFCEIKDSGQGISPENLSKIFEPFYTTRFVGRGLGLALTVGIMQRHHGAITIESTQDKGTTVRVLLPSKQSTQQTIPASAERKSNVV